MRSRGGRTTCGLAVATVGLLLAAGGAGAGTAFNPVAVEDPPGSPAFAFTPDRVSFSGLQTVNWTRGVDGDARHSITQDDGLFRLPPTKADIDYRVFFSAGTFRYFCEIHGSPGRGMDGLVRVAPTTDTEPLGPNFDVIWAFDERRETGDIFDVRFRRQGTSKWKLWLRNTRLHKDEFGLDGQPQPAVTGRTYEFQVRSKDEDDPRDRSGWSPVLTVTP